MSQSSDATDEPPYEHGEHGEYESRPFDVDQAAANPIDQWRRWHDDALDGGAAEPDAMVLATVDERGHPDARSVLVRHVDEHGFVFHTNYRSTKSVQLDGVPYAAGVFNWLELHRQVRLRGPVERVTAVESDDYFASRPRGSQIGAWASPQSEVLASRADLESLVADTEARFTQEPDVPRPPFWGGWRIVPVVIEFWQGQRDRLHDRLRYRLDETNGAWMLERLAP